jgi:hypothetical protein
MYLTSSHCHCMLLEIKVRYAKLIIKLTIKELLPIIIVSI